MNGSVCYFAVVVYLEIHITQSISKGFKKDGKIGLTFC